MPFKEGGTEASGELGSEKEKLIKIIEDKISEMHRWPGDAGKRAIPEYLKMAGEIKLGNEEAYQRALQTFSADMEAKGSPEIERKSFKPTKKDRAIEEQLEEHGGIK